MGEGGLTLHEIVILSTCLMFMGYAQKGYKPRRQKLNPHFLLARLKHDARNIYSINFFLLSIQFKD